ncbi:MAG: bifunctional oligoribonuclease/PAP phosphatase NrnA [Acidimicrobiia bacterium]|nr:bifunctional oligoribonuclease/PAP phosphatase NrnA [Acidimicrobiia bacterium]
MSDNDLYRDAAEALGHAEELILACHVGPDGDALGSMLGLAIAAENAGKSVQSSFGSPFTVPFNLRFLPQTTLVPPAELSAEPELMVVLDVGAPDRLGELAAIAAKAGTVLVLDHHVTNDGFGDIAIVEPSAAATGEIVYRLLEQLGWEVTPEIATCLLTALVTDTGRFQYSNTTPETLRIAAVLMEAGGEPTVIGRHVYEEAPFGFLKAAGSALTRAVLDEERGVVHAVITQDDLDAAEIGWGDIDHLMDTLRLAMQADVAVLAKCYSDGNVKVSLRSRGATDVGSLAASFGGGGHRLAAGFTIVGDPDEVIAQVVSKVGEHR